MIPLMSWRRVSHCGWLVKPRIHSVHYCCLAARVSLSLVGCLLNEHTFEPSAAEPYVVVSFALLLLAIPSCALRSPCQHCLSDHHATFTTSSLSAPTLACREYQTSTTASCCSKRTKTGIFHYAVVCRRLIMHDARGLGWKPAPQGQSLLCPPSAAGRSSRRSGGMASTSWQQLL